MSLPLYDLFDDKDYQMLTGHHLMALSDTGLLSDQCRIQTNLLLVLLQFRHNTGVVKSGDEVLKRALGDLKHLVSSAPQNAAFVLNECPELLQALLLTLIVPDEMVNANQEDTLTILLALSFASQKGAASSSDQGFAAIMSQKNVFETFQLAFLQNCVFIAEVKQT